MREINELLGDPFFDLLELAAEQSCESIRLLADAVRQNLGALDKLSGVNGKARRLAVEVERKLAHTVMASLKKEDIKALTDALSRIPQAAERFAQRCALCQTEVAQIHLSGLAERLCGMADLVDSMVRLLRLFDNMAAAEQLHSQLQLSAEVFEDRAQEVNRLVYERERDPLEIIKTRGLLDDLTAIASLCSDCGELIHQIVLKYA